MDAAAAPAATVAPRGVTPLTACAAAAFLVISVTIGVLVGPIELGIGPVLSSIGEKLHLPGVTSSLTATEESILWDIRMPRVVLAALVGGTLALAGATYQGVFRNPLADPYLLGVAAGAGLGATLSIAYLPGREEWPLNPLPIAAFLGGLFGVALTYVLGRSGGRTRSTATLILAGVAVAAFLTAAQTY